MNRNDSLFRVWSPKFQTMFYGSTDKYDVYIYCDGSTMVCKQSIIDTSATLSRSTGKLDSNNIMLFEYDVILTKNILNSKIYNQSEIIYKDGQFFIRHMAEFKKTKKGSFEWQKDLDDSTLYQIHEYFKTAHDEILTVGNTIDDDLEIFYMTTFQPNL